MIPQEQKYIFRYSSASATFKLIFAFIFTLIFSITLFESTDSKHSILYYSIFSFFLLYSLYKFYSNLSREVIEERIILSPSNIIVKKYLFFEPLVIDKNEIEKIEFNPSSAFHFQTFIADLISSIPGAILDALTGPPYTVSGSSNSVYKMKIKYKNKKSASFATWNLDAVNIKELEGSSEDKILAYLKNKTEELYPVPIMENKMKKIMIIENRR